jgi:hypothetical protein
MMDGMAAMTPQELTDRLLAAHAGTPQPRLRALLAALIGHLHSFAVETWLTPLEWQAGVDPIPTDPADVGYVVDMDFTLACGGDS